jgi:hypothetical protein
MSYVAIPRTQNVNNIAGFRLAFRHVGIVMKSCDKCLLALTWPIHLSALVSVTCIGWISRKFDIGDAYENL